MKPAPALPPAAAKPASVPAFDAALATPVAPTRDALTARTYCFTQPAGAGFLTLFSATGEFVTTVRVPAA